LARVSVDSEKCVGHGRCYVLAPEVFEEDDEARKGERNCPEGAIRLER
jgi:ferredoxin